MTIFIRNRNGDIRKARLDDIPMDMRGLYNAKICPRCKTTYAKEYMNCYSKKCKNVSLTRLYEDE